MFLRRAISKFKSDFEEAGGTLKLSDFDVNQGLMSFEEDLVLRPDTSSIRTTSDNVSRYGASLSDHDLPPIPSEDSSESVGPLQKRSLLHSLQHNSSPNDNSLPSIESSSSTKDKLTPILGSPIPIDPMNKEFAKVSNLLNAPKKKSKNSSSSHESSIPSITPATHSTESYQPNSFTAKALLSDSESHRKESNVPALFFKKPNGARVHYDTEKNKFLFENADRVMPPNASSTTTNGNTVPSTPLAREVPNSLSHINPEVHNERTMESIQPPLLNSTSPRNHDEPMESIQFPVPNSTPHHSHDEPMESIRSSVTQAPQHFRDSSPHDDPLIQATSPTVKVNNNDNNHEHISETKDHPDSTPKSQPLPLTSNKSSEEILLPPFIQRETSVPGDFPLDETSTSSSYSRSATKANDNLTCPKDKRESRRKPSSSSMNQFLIAMAIPQTTPQAVSTEVPENVEQSKTTWRPKRSLQTIGESSDPLSPNGPSPSVFFRGDGLYKKLEELGAMRRMESRSQLSQFKTGPDGTSQQPTQPIRMPATPKIEILPQLQPVQEDSLSDVSTMLREAYAERQRELQTQLDKALAELQGVRAENKRLTNENQSQQRTITQLKSSLDEAKNSQDIKNQLRDATSSLAVLKKEKKGWQDKLDSMQRKLNVAERQVRCLDHITRHKLESRQELAYGPPKRGGHFASILASTDVIGAMRALNEEIYQTCVQLVEGLERTSTHSNKHKLKTQELMGNRLTLMMEDQATKTTDYDVLLMQSVLEVFMAHWCSSIIEAFYPKQESFADLLIQLSAQTAKASGK